MVWDPIFLLPVTCLGPGRTDRLVRLGVSWGKPGFLVLVATASPVSKGRRIPITTAAAAVLTTFPMPFKGRGPGVAVCAETGQPRRARRCGVVSATVAVGRRPRSVTSTTLVARFAVDGRV